MPSNGEALFRIQERVYARVHMKCVSDFTKVHKLNFHMTSYPRISKVITPLAYYLSFLLNGAFA